MNMPTFSENFEELPEGLLCTPFWFGPTFSFVANILTFGIFKKDCAQLPNFTNRYSESC